MSEKERKRQVLEAMSSPLQVDFIQETAERIADAELRGRFDTLTGLYNIAAFERFYESTIEHIEPDKISAFVFIHSSLGVFFPIV